MSALPLTAHHYLRSCAAVCYLIRLFSIQEESSALKYSQYYAFNSFPPEEQRDGERERLGVGGGKRGRNRRILMGRVKFHRTKARY